jgi:hypothetical protein
MNEDRVVGTATNLGGKAYNRCSVRTFLDRVRPRSRMLLKGPNSFDSLCYSESWATGALRGSVS